MNTRALFVALGTLALAVYGVVATSNPVNQFGRILAACGARMVTVSQLWLSVLALYIGPCPEPCPRLGKSDLLWDTHNRPNPQQLQAT